MPQPYLLNNFKRIIFSFLFSLFISSSIFISYGEGAALNKPSFYAESWEPYSVRPDILTLESHNHELGPLWDSSKAAQFSFIASLLAFNDEKTHFYFIARDSEYLYDTARLVTQNSENAKRIHLINISRLNLDDSQTKMYLAQQGLTQDNLLHERKALFIDTGFSGTVPRNIEEFFKNQALDHIHTQLLVSSNRHIPSSRIFLSYFDLHAYEKSPLSMHPKIIDYESLPKYTERSDAFINYNGILEPISPKVKSSYRIGTGTLGGYHYSDGLVSPLLSTRHMEDLKAYWDRPSVQKQFYQEYSDLVWLKKVSLKPDGEYLIKKKLDELKNSLERNFFEAQIRDLAEHRQKISRNQHPLDLKKIGIKPEIYTSDSESFNQKKIAQLIQDNPEKWNHFFTNPHQNIFNLFNKKDWTSIEELIEMKPNLSITRILAKHIFTPSLIHERPDLPVSFIYHADPHTLQDLAIYIFKNPETERMEDLIKLTIERGNQSTLYWLTLYTFTQPHTGSMSEALKALIKKGDQTVLSELATHVFSQPHVQDLESLLLLTIEKANQVVLKHLIQYTFSKPHTQKMNKALDLLKKKSFPRTLALLEDTQKEKKLSLPPLCRSLWL
jgi:hypothetical protein